MTATKSVVTGGSGFIGRLLVDALLARGDDVTVVDFSEKPPRPDVRFLRVDLRDADKTRAFCAGQDVIFHNASIVHTRRSREEDVWAVNFGGARNVLAGCREHGVARLVYVSSASAVYEGRDIENGDESLPYSRISQAPYADSKIAAEKEILQANGKGGLLTCAIRPHVVFGPGDERFLPAILQRAKTGRLKYGVGLGRKLSDFTYASNVADALLLADEKLVPGSMAAGHAYFITNGEPMGFWDFVSQILARLRLPPIRGRVPFPIAYAVAAAYEAVDTLRGGTLNSEDGLSRFAIRYMCTHHYFSIARARRDLGYVPAVSIADGIERTARHLEQTGLA
ncbi:MAG TPA: NAD-dependent epimerase/dehydratase family protein [Polyangiaceae bacterium]|nr:NAD-dependent epimerase/dehydratase family protein [Polyangiaceae bacterium]